MKKNKLIIVGLLIGVGTFFGSCEHQIFEDPYAQLPPEEAFSTAERIEKSATGMYDALQNRDFLGGRVLIYADIRGIDAGVPTFFGNMSSFNTLISTDLTVRNAFVGAYRTVNEANLFLKNIAQYGGVATPENEAKYIAEAKFIRALTYFYLVNLWAQPYNFTPDASHLGVPLVLSATDLPFDPSHRVGRSTVKEVYDQIILDLTEALPNLPDAPQVKSFASVARATKGAVYALLSRIYLYQGKYQDALSNANSVIGLNVYDLNSDPKETFTTYTTNESIFSVAHSGGDNPNTNHALGQHYSPNNRADIQASSDFVNLMSASDLRRKNLITTVVTEGVDGAPDVTTYWNGKYTTIGDWAPIMRYSEVILTKAEALANLESGTIANAEALTLVNDIRHRSDPTTTILAATKQQLINAILLERRIELAYEGHGIFEYLRTGRDIPAHGSVLLQEWGSSYVVFPFPFAETQQNPNLDQNDDY